MRRFLQSSSNIRPRQTRRAAFVWIGVLLSCLASVSSAQSSELKPSDIESAYLYNFGKFVSWPATPDASSASFVICIVGKDDFGATLDTLIANESIQGRQIAVKRLPSIVGADGCQMVYLGTSEEGRLTKDLDALKDKPILTVSGLPGFLNHGGMIQFLLQKNKVRFSVNLASATRARLVLSSELLKVAVSVTPDPGVAQ